MGIFITYKFRRSVVKSMKQIQFNYVIRSPSQKSDISANSVSSSPDSKPRKAAADDPLFGDVSTPTSINTNTTAKPFKATTIAAPAAVSKVSAPKPNKAVGKLQVS